MCNIEYITGRVYKIQVKDKFKNSANMLSLEQLEYINHIYVGSTTKTLKYRLIHHIKTTRANTCSSKILVSLFSADWIDIALIKEYIVQKESNNRCLLMYETLHMNKLRLNNYKLINRQHSFRIDYIANRDAYLRNKDTAAYKERVIRKRNNNNIGKVIENNKISYVCYECDLKFNTKILFKEHKDSFHKENNYKQYKYTCKHCNINSNDKVIFAKHVKSKEHLALNLTIEEEDEIYKFMYTCDRCQFKCDSKKDYSNHLISKLHRELFNITEEFRYKCDVCKYYQNQEKLFNRHLKSKRHIELCS